MRQANGIEPMVFVEMRSAPWPWWRRWHDVRLVVTTALLVVAGAALTVAWSTGEPVPLALALELYGVALVACVVGTGRPCVGCGRWGRHTLLCAHRPPRRS